MADKHEIAERLHAQLTLGAALRASARACDTTTRTRQQFRQWQSERLARTHPDLLDSPRYRQLALFFLSELYGPADLTQRYAEAERVMTLAVKLLPVSGLEVVADAVELDALSESLDADMIMALGPDLDALDNATYGNAYRRVGRRADRDRQIALIGDLGRSLDRLANLPLAHATLKQMRLPARLLGLADLQNFLERGFEAFHTMRGAEEFVATIVAREATLSKALFAGDDSLLTRPANSWPTATAWATAAWAGRSDSH